MQTSPLLHPLSLVIASTSTLTSSTYPVSPRLITQLSCWHFQTESQHVQNQLLISPTPDFFGCSGQKPWSHPGLLSHSPHWSSCGSFFANRPSLLLSGLLQQPPHWSPHFHPDQTPSSSLLPPQSILHTAVPAILLTRKSDQILPLPNLSKDFLFVHRTSRSLYTATRPYTILPVISLTCSLVILPF